MSVGLLSMLPTSNDGPEMHYDEIVQLQEQHASWALLRSPHAPLMLSFFGRVFVEANRGGQPCRRSWSACWTTSCTRSTSGRGRTRSRGRAQAYLDDWAAPETSLAAQVLPAGHRRAALRPHAGGREGACCGCRICGAVTFVGTESRLNTLFELLRQMVFGADDDPQRRLADLRRRRAELDEQIARAERGEVELLDAAPVSATAITSSPATPANCWPTSARSRRTSASSIAACGEQIAGWTGSKGELLDESLASRSSIAESDQGRSFQALYDFLLSHQRQAELSELLDRLGHIDDLEDLRPAAAAPCTSTGSTRASAPRARSGCCRSSCAASSTTRSGWRTGASSSCCAASRRTGGRVRAVSRRRLDHGAGRHGGRGAVAVRAAALRAASRPVSSTPTEVEPAIRRLRGRRPARASVHVDRDELARTVRSSLRDRDQVGLAPLIERPPAGARDWPN